MFKIFNTMASLKKNYYARELAVITLGAMTVFLVCSLLSFNPYDQSWFYELSSPAPITNWCGIVGAYCASLLFYLIGSSSFVLAGLLGFCSYCVFLKRKFRDEWDRCVAGLLLLCIVPALQTTYAVDFWASPYPGGFIGSCVSGMFHSWCDALGAIIVLHMMLIMSLIVLLRFSFIGLIHAALNSASWQSVEKKLMKPCLHGISIAYRYCRHGYRFAKQFIAWPYQRFFPKYTAETIEFEGGRIDPSIFEQFHDIAPMPLYPEPSVQAEPARVMPEPVAAKQAQGTPKEMHDALPQYILPNLDIFIADTDESQDTALMQELEKRASLLQEKLERFGVYGKVVAIKRGPVVTLFEYQPQMDTKISKITALEDDLAMVLQTMSIRILAPIPGKSVVGFEVANKQRKGVLLATLIKAEQYANTKAALPMILGVDTIGNLVVADLARMPHLLMAGSTGSGKSVALNAMLISLLCKTSPEDVRLVLIDPKRLEFAPYADIAHLLFPIVTDPKQSPPILRFIVQEMEQRYEKMAQAGARNIGDYRVLAHKNKLQPMPYIVVIIDELSDLMMTAGREIEDLIIRITQMARAAGIHLIAATQRPSVDVITGLIKVNFPSRISFKVSSKVDSRTILDCGGADKLLGKGDMLFLDATDAALKRIHGAYVLDSEITQIVAHIRKQRPPVYQDLKQVCKDFDEEAVADEMYHSICDFLQEVEEVSISLLQRRFRIGYNRSARIIDLLEAQGLISPAHGGKTRKVVKQN